MDDEIKFNIDVIREDGEPIAPKKNADKFTTQCGVFVRDQIPINIQEWNKPKEGRGFSFADQRAKDTLWETLISHFNLPESLTDHQREKVKK